MDGATVPVGTPPLAPSVGLLRHRWRLRCCYSGIVGAFDVVGLPRAWDSGASCDAGGLGRAFWPGPGQPLPLLTDWISSTATLRAQFRGLRVAPGTGRQLAGGGPSTTPGTQQARQV